MPGQVPTIGRIVHYVAPMGADTGEHYPAIITHVEENQQNHPVNLYVFPKGSPHGLVSPVVVISCTRNDDGVTANTWHWPELAAAASSVASSSVVPEQVFPEGRSNVPDSNPT